MIGLDDITRYFFDIVPGIPVTLGLVSLSLLVGFGMAYLILIGNLFSNRYGRKCIDLFVSVFRGSPLLVQMFFLYYGLGYLLTDFLPFRVDGFWYAICGLSLNTAAYTSVILLGAVNSVSKEQIESGKCLGVTPWRIFRKIVFPQAIRYALPAYGNEMILITKASSLASTITVMEITGYSTQLASRTYDIIPVFGIAAIIYLSINIFLILSVRFLEKLLSQGSKVA